MSTATTLEGAKQTLALGPVASQEAIKMLGTNGGGFFNANSAHPFENPTALCNFVQMLSIFVIGSGLTLTFGKAVGNFRQGWAILAAMLAIFLAGVAVGLRRRGRGQPDRPRARASPAATWKARKCASASPRLRCSPRSPRRPRAARSTRCTTASRRSAGWSRCSTSSSARSSIGGVGSGFYGMLLFAILAVFIAGLMVGRTPEYVGKKIEGREMKLAVLAIVVLPLFILGLTALASVLPAGLAGPQSKGPHGFSEILYAYLERGREQRLRVRGPHRATRPFYNGMLALAMWFGRFGVIVPDARHRRRPRRQEPHCPRPPARSRRPARCGWACWSASILILGGLTFLPSLALGPIADHLAMIAASHLQ